MERNTFKIILLLCIINFKIADVVTLTNTLSAIIRAGTKLGSAMAIGLKINDVLEANKQAEKSIREIINATVEFVIATKSPEGDSKDAAKKVQKLKKSLERVLENAGAIVKSMINLEKSTHVLVLGSLYHIKEDINNINSALASIESQIQYNDSSVDMFLKKLKQFIFEAQSIENSHYLFAIYSTKLSSYVLSRVSKFCANNLAPIINESVWTRIRRMYNILTQEDGLLQLIKDSAVERYIITSREISSMQFLQHLFMYYLFVEARSLTIVKFAKVFLETYDESPDDTYEEQFEDYVDDATDRCIFAVKLATMYLSTLSGRFWVQDVKSKPIGNQYVTFKNFIRGYVYRESDCEYAGTTKGESRCKLSDNHTCSGELILIEQHRFFNPLHVCYSPDSDDGRMYDYVSADKVPDVKCSGELLSYAALDNCNNCFFVCYDKRNRKSNNYISMDEMVSDIDKNCVLTGLRFNRRDKIITVDIQQAQLDDAGHVIKNTSEWIINKGRKVFSFKYPNKMSIYLKEIKSYSEYVVTGLRFNKISDGVELQIRSNELIWCAQNVSILSGTSTWTRNEQEVKERILLDDLNLPTKNPLLDIYGFDNYAIRITTSSFATDGGQTPLPFFDTRPIIHHIPVPLRGLGLMYKAERQGNYAGYIAPYVLVTNPVGLIDLNDPIFETRSVSVRHFNLATFAYHIIVINYVILLIY